MRGKQAGLTLIELLLALTVAAILLLQLAQPSWQQLRTRRQTDLMMLELQQLIAMARLTAVSENRTVTLCRSNDGLHCQGQWHEGSILFTDADADRRINGDDRLLHRAPALPLPGHLHFNAFRNRQYLQMTPQGVTAYQNGNFTWCPADRSPALVRQLILSFSGRTRMARDRDGDGVVENSQGKPVQCSK